ncbi:hypothetical protein BDR26DRAFT_871951 [Obelidium mucronatum]|nr:hypothetical protein BDR26DRAFT_871951 [Obelidium mucronatum]
MHPSETQTSDEIWSLTTHVPQEMITAIFSWIHPGDVKNEPFFHNLNVRNFYRRLNPTEDVVGIRYSVFPYLEKVGKLTFRTASRMAERLKLPIDLNRLNPRTLMNDKDVNRKGPHPFDPATEVLIFWSHQDKERPLQETVTVFVPAYRELGQSGCRRASVRAKIPYTMFPCDTYSWHIWRDVYDREDSRIDIKNLLEMLQDFMVEYSLGEPCYPTYACGSKPIHDTAISLFKYTSSGSLIPFDPATERLHLTPNSQIQWDELFQTGMDAMQEQQWSVAIQTFRDLVTAKLDFYGFKDPRAYENHVDLAKVYLAQKRYREASGALCVYFENGPQGGVGAEPVFEKAAKIMQSLAEFGNCDGIKTYDLVPSEHNLKLKTELRPIYFKTGLFCGRIAVNSLHVTGQYLYDQGRYQEAWTKFKASYDRRAVFFPTQGAELQETKDMLRATKWECCKGYAAMQQWSQALELGTEYYDECVQEFGSHGEKTVEASEFLRRCREELET